MQVPVGAGTARAADPAAAADPDATVPLDDDGHLQHPAFAAPPALALWRAPTDNDRIGGMAARWAQAGVDRLERRLVGIERSGAATVVRSVYATAAGIEVPHEATYTPLPGGAISVVETVELPDALDDLPRVGTVLELRPGLESLRWFGSGPHETYPDRKRGGLIGTLGLDASATSTSRTSARRRTAATPTSAGWRSPATATRPPASGSNSTSRARSRSRTSAPPTSPRRPTTSTSSRSRRPSSISTPPIAGSGRRAAAPTPSRNTGSRPGTYRWAWTIRDLPRS